MTTALIIEDNVDNMALVSFILEQSGYATVKAVTGEEGLHAAVEHSPDVVLLDVQLPDIDGYEVLRRLRSSAQTAALPVIAVTSYAMSGDRESLIAAGCNGYIEKPINPDAMIEELEKVIMQSRL